MNGNGLGVWIEVSTERLYVPRITCAVVTFRCLLGDATSIPIGTPLFAVFWQTNTPTSFVQPRLNLIMTCMFPPILLGCRPGV